MSRLSLHHIGIKVSSIDKILETFSQLGLICEENEICSEVGLRIACVPLGNIKIEFLEIMDENSPIAQDPHGLHHVALGTKNLEKWYHMMALSNAFKVDGKIRLGLHHRKLFFFRLKEAPDTLYECVEAP